MRERVGGRVAEEMKWMREDKRGESKHVQGEEDE